MISPSGESKEAEVGVRTISAPRARITFTFSSDIFSGMTMMQRYPFTAAAIAKPRPDINIGHVTSHKLKYIYIIRLQKFMYVVMLNSLVGEQIGY